MVYAVLLSGGMGTRLGLPVPKQFLKIGSKTLLEHAVQKFVVNEEIAHTVVVVPENWYAQSQEIISKHNFSNLSICMGGNSRQESLYKGLMWLCQNFAIADADIVVSHDVARPFVTTRMIKENIKICRLYGAADTVVASPDTIVRSMDKDTISEVPVREEMYLGQTPQTFFINKFIEIYEKLSPDYLAKVTDAARILSDHDVTVGLVTGDVSNMKITTLFDLNIANSILIQAK